MAPQHPQHPQHPQQVMAPEHRLDHHPRSLLIASIASIALATSLTGCTERTIPVDGGVEEVQIDYQDRLPGDPSRDPAQCVIELPPGMFETLGIEIGDRIDIPTERLKRLGEESDDDDKVAGSSR